MILRRHHCLEFVLALLPLANLCDAQSQYRFQHFDSKDGLADNFVFSISQDSLGYMWFQYYSGLTRYDGYNFKVYTNDENNARLAGLDFGLGRLYKDGRGNVWVNKHVHPPRPPFVIAKIDSKADGFKKHTVDLGQITVGSVAVDRDEILWIGTFWGKGLLRYDPSTGDTSRYLNYVNGRQFALAQNSIFDIKDLGSKLLILTTRGVWNFDKSTRKFSRPTCNPKDSSFLYNTWFVDVVQKSEKNFWMVESTIEMDSRPTGIVNVDENWSVIQRTALPSDFQQHQTSGIDVDAEGIVWISTWTNGLFRYDATDRSFTHIQHDPSDPNSLSDNQVNSVFIDRDQNVWVATSKGASKLYRQLLHPVNLQGGGVGGVFDAKKDQFIFIAEGKQRLPLNSFEITMAPISSGLDWSHFKKVTTSFDAVAITRCYQGKNYFWVRAYPTGVFGYPINPTSGMPDKTPLHFYSDSSNPNTISVSGISAIWEDPDEMLWVSGVGLHKVDRRIPYGEKGSVTTYLHIESDTSSICSDLIYHIYPEDERSFWLLTDGGLELCHSDTEKFEHVVKAREFVSSLCRTSDGMLYLGTTKGLFKLNKASGHYRLEKAALWNRADVRAIQEDRAGRLWLLTPLGLVCFDRKENIGLEFNDDDYTKNVYTLDNQRLHKTSQGLMVAVTDEGITLFDPMRLTMDRKITHPLITKVEINNRPVSVDFVGNDDDFLIPASISMLRDLTLDYKHNNFKVEFSAMEMNSPHKNLYRHKLDGYDDDWIEADFRNRTAAYTNLDPGEYMLRIKASNHHGIWSDTEQTLKVIILPPPWKTTWAYVAYGIILVGLLYAARKIIVQRERLKSNLKIAEVEREKEHFELEKAKEVDKMKSTFFANISHEFRTPLTLIKGPVQAVMEELSDHPKIKERLKLAERNADLVLRLINQLLDLAKLESGTLAVEKSTNDFNSFVSAIVSSFSSLAFQKNVSLTTQLPSVRYLVRFDRDKVETILINLINNAIKFTHSGGNVQVSASFDSENAVTLNVSDTGIGIPVDQQHKVFERFHQVSEAHTEIGTGIGLSLVKELVSLMNGSITLHSTPGKGSTFKVTLPVERLREVTELPETDLMNESIYVGAIVAQENGSDHASDQRPRVLVVEDNKDLRKFIIDSLGKEFYFLEAENGKHGLQIAFEEIPDLILSDVMMPEMDGITMTRQIKEDIRTSHIPLVLLTAKTSDESKLSGLSTGADDYLTKPFNKNELLLKVRNSIAHQVKLREKIKLELLKESPKVEVQSADEKFLLKVREAILQRLSDEQLSVESLAEEMALSRSQLFRKITALTGASVNELIRTFRLQRAAQLLEQNWGPVTQVAYEVGFSNLSYFSKVFKEQYGIMPSEYPAKTM